MIGVEHGTVRDVGERWPGAALLTLLLDRGDVVPGLAYPPLVGDPQPGDRALVTTAALDAELGTGGLALVVHLEGRRGADPGGRLVKARYTPQQVLLAEPADPGVSDLGGLPVVVADLHSALPAVVAGVRAGHRELRVVYVMDDAAGLPLWHSRTVAGLRAAGWLAGTVTTGQAFGGDLEAVTLHSGLLAARGLLRADVAVVCPGPGAMGTASTWGFSGVAAGEAVNAVGVLGGRPVAALRLSGADPRPRHRPLSHHSATAYGRVALQPADIPVPADDPELHRAVVGSDIGRCARHRIVRVDVTGLDEALAASPVALSTMGRGLAEDPLYFLANAVAGRHAAGLRAGPGRIEA